MLEKANSAIEYLLSIGCAPVANRYSSYVKPSTSTPANGNSTSANGGNQASWCPIHNMEMKRWEKDGRVWFSHKVGDEWCSGKPKRR